MYRYSASVCRSTIYKNYFEIFAAPVRDFILDSLIQFGISLVIPIRKKDRVPSECCLASRLDYLPGRPSHEDVWLRLRTCKKYPGHSKPYVVLRYDIQLFGNCQSQKAD